jgi:prephenate dehydrogenase
MADEICGYVRRDSSIAECLQAGAVDRATTVLAEAIQGADLIVLCTPLLQMGELSREIVQYIQTGALVTDVGSVKKALVAELEPIFSNRGATFIGSHPMAGSEKMGVSAAREDLFANAVCIVTPTEKSPAESIDQIEFLWRGVGGRVMRLSPGIHDQLAARSSHLPHLLAAKLAAFVLNPENHPDQGRLCASGFRDSTRIASGSPEMWRDIVLMNRDEVLTALDRFTSELLELRTILERSDAPAIEEYFRTAKDLRDEWYGRCASTSPE